MAKIISIAVSNLVAPADLLRVHSDPKADYIVERQKDLAANGQISPISVWDNGDGTFTHGDGSCRIVSVRGLAERGVAVKGLQVGEIKCVVEGMYSSAIAEQIFTQQIRANAHLKATAAKEYVAAIDRLQNKFNHSPAEVQEILGIAPSTYYNWLKVIRLPEDVREKVASGEIGINNAIELSRVVGKPGYEEAVNKATELTTEEFVAYVEENKPAKGTSKSNDEFVPKITMPTKTLLEALYAKALVKGGEFLTAIQEVTGLTEEAVAEQKATWEADKKVKEEKKKAPKKISDLTEEDLEKLLAERKANAEAN
jgi:hypothetical protein